MFGALPLISIYITGMIALSSLFLIIVLSKLTFNLCKKYYDILLTSDMSNKDNRYRIQIFSKLAISLRHYYGVNIFVIISIIAFRYSMLILFTIFNTFDPPGKFTALLLLFISLVGFDVTYFLYRTKNIGTRSVGDYLYIDRPINYGSFKTSLSLFITKLETKELIGFTKLVKQMNSREYVARYLVKAKKTTHAICYILIFVKIIKIFL